MQCQPGTAAVSDTRIGSIISSCRFLQLYLARSTSITLSTQNTLLLRLLLIQVRAAPCACMPLDIWAQGRQVASPAASTRPVAHDRLPPGHAWRGFNAACKQRGALVVWRDTLGGGQACCKLIVLRIISRQAYLILSSAGGGAKL
jgi:hypothetical protein